MSETETAIAERTIHSLKNNLYRYMEDYAYKYTHTLPQLIATMNSRNNRSIDMKPNHVKNSDFTSILYSEPFKEYKKPKFGIGDSVRNPKNDLTFRKCFINHNLHKNFLKWSPLLLKNLQHIQSKTNKKKLYV